MFALDTSSYTTTQFFSYTLATQQKFATRWIHGYTIRKRLISASYTMFIKIFYKILRAAVNMYVGFLLELNQLKNRRNLRQITYFCTSFNSQKLVFFYAKYIKTYGLVRVSRQNAP